MVCSDMPCITSDQGEVWWLGRRLRSEQYICFADDLTEIWSHNLLRRRCHDALLNLNVIYMAELLRACTELRRALISTTTSSSCTRL